MNTLLGERGRAGVKVTLQCVHLAAQNVAERLHLRKLLPQPTTTLEKEISC